MPAQTPEKPESPKILSRLPDFIHLRLHSSYSLLEGALHMTELPQLCIRNNMPALALTDSNNLFGALEFSQTMAKAGIQPIAGLTLAINTADPAHSDTAFNKENSTYPTLAFLAMNERGYHNLIALSSRAFLDHGAADAHIQFDDIRHYHEGLICLSGGGEGLLNRLYLNAQYDAADHYTERLHTIFTNRFYIELQRHGKKQEIEAEKHLIQTAYNHNIPLVATNQPYFAAKEDALAHDALICIAQGRYLSEQDRPRYTEEHYFKSQQEMKALFHDLPEAIENTVEIARRCHFRPRTHKPILPKFTQISNKAENEKSHPKLSEAELLREAAIHGLDHRLRAQNGPAPGHSAEAYKKQLDYELDIITGMNFAGYFLIVADFVKWAKTQGIPVGPGRGSGAGSVVSWALMITGLDPLRFNLIFERFLNPERISMPDFDIDFCQERRDEVINYVRNTYGTHNTAQIITFGTLQARQVCRDVGRVLNMSYSHVDRLCKMIPYNPANPTDLRQAIESEPRLREERDKDTQVATLFEIGLKLEKLYRHASIHAAGVVIGDRPLSDHIPLYRDDPQGAVATQFSMKWVEAAGLVKFDFLGLKTLTIIDKIVHLLKHRDIVLNPEAIPLDHADTYAMLAKGETVGVFQLESAGMKDLLRKSSPDNIEDVIALVALYRPGPMENIPRYIASKKGEEKHEYFHDSISPILADTYGVIIYQEQVLQIAQSLAGYSLGEADILRRAMGKKIKKEMKQQKTRFIEGAAKNNIERKHAEFIYERVAKFAGYGFNRAHSAGYGLIAYQTAWLKTNYPVEFIAASMSLELNNTDKLAVFRQEAQRMNVSILPPSILHSHTDFVVENGAVRYSLLALKNVGHNAVDHIVKMREKEGHFTSIEDFVRRFDPHILNRRALEGLIKAGAFDPLHANRAQLFNAIDAIIEYAEKKKKERDCGQSNLFDINPQPQHNPHMPHNAHTQNGDNHRQNDLFFLSECNQWTQDEQCTREHEAIGFYFSAHPLDAYMEIMAKTKNVITWKEFTNNIPKGRTHVARISGVIAYKKEKKSGHGNRYAFIGLSDPSGQYETVCFGDLLEKERDNLKPGAIIAITVEGEREGDNVKLKMKDVFALHDMIEKIKKTKKPAPPADPAQTSQKHTPTENNPTSEPVPHILHPEHTARIESTIEPLPKPPVETSPISEPTAKPIPAPPEILHIVLETPAALPAISSILPNQGNHTVHIIWRQKCTANDTGNSVKEITIRLGNQFSFTSDIKDKIRHMPGVLHVFAS